MSEQQQQQQTATPPDNGGGQTTPPTPPPPTPPPTEEQQQQGQQQTTPPAEDAQASLLKSLGFEKLEDLQANLKKLQEIEDANKSELEKTAEKARKAADKLKEYEEQVFTLSAEKAALQADANPDNVGDIITLAKAQVNKDTDITKAIGIVLEKYPHFKKAGAAQGQGSGNDGKPQFAQQQQGQQQTEQDKWNAAFKNMFAKN